MPQYLTELVLKNVKGKMKIWINKTRAVKLPSVEVNDSDLKKKVKEVFDEMYVDVFGRIFWALDPKYGTSIST